MRRFSGIDAIRRPSAFVMNIPSIRGCEIVGSLKPFVALEIRYLGGQNFATVG